MAFVSFQDVHKVYAMGDVSVIAVDGMTFSIEQGELCIIVGPSGAGKTTVLNMLGGMDSPTSGTIYLGDKCVSSMDKRQLTAYRRNDIGFVFQFYNLVQNLTALENVELAASNSAWPLPEPSRRIQRCCCAMSQPAHWITAPANQFSSFCKIPATKPGRRWLSSPTTLPLHRSQTA